MILEPASGHTRVPTRDFETFDRTSLAGDEPKSRFVDINGEIWVFQEIVVTSAELPVVSVMCT
jgi:hypothetical protein